MIFTKMMIAHAILVVWIVIIGTQDIAALYVYGKMVEKNHLGVRIVTQWIFKEKT